MVTSQACLTIDAISGRYADGRIGCTISSGVLAHWLTNFAMFVGCLLMIYELIRVYTNSPRVALL
jgi:hypothetical protein